MNRIVADTDPLNYLIQIDLAPLLGVLVEQVLIPESVATELRDPRAPDAVMQEVLGSQPWEHWGFCEPRLSKTW